MNGLNRARAQQGPNESPRMGPGPKWAQQCGTVKYWALELKYAKYWVNSPACPHYIISYLAIYFHELEVGTILGVEKGHNLSCIQFSRVE